MFMDMDGCIAVLLELKGRASLPGSILDVGAAAKLF
jgi:hypothetical protein